MISSDEETGDEAKEKWIQPPSRAHSPQVQATSEEVWVDPICKIFQLPPEAENLAGSLAVTVAAAVPAAMVNPLAPVVAEAGCSHQSSLENATKRETFFLDMGFPFDLVQRAIRHHGVYM